MTGKCGCGYYLDDHGFRTGTLICPEKPQAISDSQKNKTGLKYENADTTFKPHGGVHYAGRDPMKDWIPSNIGLLGVPWASPKFYGGPRKQEWYE